VELGGPIRWLRGRFVLGLASLVRSACSADLESRASSSTCRLPTLASWSALWAVFVLKAGPSWVKLKICKWNHPRGFTVRVLSIKQTNIQTNMSFNKEVPAVFVCYFSIYLCACFCVSVCRFTCLSQPISRQLKSTPI